MKSGCVSLEDMQREMGGAQRAPTIPCIFSKYPELRLAPHTASTIHQATSTTCHQQNARAEKPSATPFILQKTATLPMQQSPTPSNRMPAHKRHDVFARSHMRHRYPSKANTVYHMTTLITYTSTVKPSSFLQGSLHRKRSLISYYVPSVCFARQRDCLPRSQPHNTHTILGMLHRRHIS